MRRASVLVLAAFISPLVFAASLSSCGGDSAASGVTASGSGGSSNHGSSGTSGTGGNEVGMKDAPSDVNHDAPVEMNKGFCSLPGSIQFTTQGVGTVKGGMPVCQPGNLDGCETDLSFLTLPVGFCAHYFGRVGNARQIRFAPGGELFVASPTTTTTGGGPQGESAVVVLTDDDKDGYADTPNCVPPGSTSCNRFVSQLPSTQGLLFANSSFYYQDDTRIMKMPYASGDRTPSAKAKMIADASAANGFYISLGNAHWPKTLDIADDGTIYFGNGGSDTDPCLAENPFHGGVLKIGANGKIEKVAKGMRNPIAIRCARGHNRCFAIELAKDFSNPDGGREKIVPIREGDDWGFPCCATKNKPYTNISPKPDCSGVSPESESFTIGYTPFGIAFEPGNWPAPHKGQAFLVLHGFVGSWEGARLMEVAMDPTTGLLVTGSDVGDPPTGGLTDFGSGWYDGLNDHGRPAAVEFSSDGRLFVANDNDGSIIWIAPIDPGG